MNSMNQLPVVERALRLATRAHEGQKRKDVDLPYIIHPVAVALIVAQYGFSETVIAAALCHDVLEDTEVTEDELRDELGDDVATIVKLLSYDEGISWEEQRKRYVEVVRAAPIEVKAVSTADKIHNARSLIATYAERGPTAWSLFTRPKHIKLWFEEEMVKMLRETWQHPMIEEYARLVEQMQSLDQ